MGHHRPCRGRDIGNSPEDSQGGCLTHHTDGWPAWRGARWDVRQSDHRVPLVHRNGGNIAYDQRDTLDNYV